MSPRLVQEILAAGQVDMPLAEQKIRQVSSLRADLEVMSLKLRSRLKAKLTPKQLEKLQKDMPYKKNETRQDGPPPHDARENAGGFKAR